MTFNMHTFHTKQSLKHIVLMVFIKLIIIIIVMQHKLNHSNLAWRFRVMLKKGKKHFNNQCWWW